MGGQVVKYADYEALWRTLAGFRLDKLEELCREMSVTVKEQGESVPWRGLYALVSYGHGTGEEQVYGEERSVLYAKGAALAVSAHLIAIQRARHSLDRLMTIVENDRICFQLERLMLRAIMPGADTSRRSPGEMSDG